MEQTLLDLLRYLKSELKRNIRTLHGDDVLLEEINKVYKNKYGVEIIEDDQGNYYKGGNDSHSYIKVDNFIELVYYLIKEEEGNFPESTMILSGTYDFRRQHRMRELKDNVLDTTEEYYIYLDEESFRTLLEALEVEGEDEIYYRKDVKFGNTQEYIEHVIRSLGREYAE